MAAAEALSVRRKAAIHSLRTALALVMAMIFWLQGCGSAGPERFAVKGTVTLDGEPVSEGSISFIPSGPEGGPTTGSLIENGKFSIPAEKGAVLGDHKVEIRAPKQTGNQIPVTPPAVSPDGMVDEVVESIPEKYNSKTTLIHTIERGPNVVEFDLTSDEE